MKYGQYDPRFRRRDNTPSPYARPGPYVARFSNERGAGQSVAWAMNAAVTKAADEAFQGRARGVTLDEAATNEEYRLRRDRAACRPPTPITFQRSPYEQQGGEGAPTPRVSQAYDGVQNDRVLSTPPQSPSDPPSHPPSPAQRGVGFTINVPFDSSQPFTFTNNNSNEEFPSLSDLLRPSQSAHVQSPPTPTAGPSVSNMQPDAHHRLACETEEQYNYSTPVVHDQVAQNANPQVYNGYPMLSNQWPEQQQAIAPMPVQYVQYQAPYGGGFVRSSAPSPSPQPFIYPYVMVQPAPMLTPTYEVLQPLTGEQFARVILWVMALPNHTEYANPFTADRRAEP